MKCLCMFSGGLDSVVAAHLLKSQGVEVIALHFVLPFQSGVGLEHRDVRRAADVLGIELRIEEEDERFLAMLRSPEFGYGKNVNPCVDCRIHRIQKAAAIMHEIGAAFIATGEVVGQRPMSQKKNTMGAISKRAGVKGLLVRPLSAQVLEPTIPEREGWVDRSRLLDISGRGRKQQLAYARRHRLYHGAPGGGCLLTEKEVARRYRDLEEHQPKFNLNDFKLLAYGRHFRLSSLCRLIVGRNHAENIAISNLALPADYRIRMSAIEGPTGLARGVSGVEQLTAAASIVARYSKDRNKQSTSLAVHHEGAESIVTVTPADESLCDRLRV